MHKYILKALIVCLLATPAVAIETTPTGLYYPTGTRDPGPYTGWLASGCQEGDPYFDEFYHIGHDYKTVLDAPVFLIADGYIEDVSDNGWGAGNQAVLVRHRLSDGGDFHALYGHIQTEYTDSDVGLTVFARDTLGTVGYWADGIHLHFGIHPGTNTPPSPWGMMACPLDDPPATNGFVDPIGWIETQIPDSDVGRFSDGWHDDGVSEVFLNAYSDFITDPNNPDRNSLGIPLNNSGDPANTDAVFIHENYGMWVQDFYGADNGLVHEYTSLIKGPNESDPVCLLKEGFWYHYWNNGGWLSYGYPVSDEEAWTDGDGITWQRQNFIEPDGTERYLLWNEYAGVVPMGTIGDELLHLFRTIFNLYPGSKNMLNGIMSAGDGVYYSGQFVADYGVPIHLLEGQSYGGLYAIVGGVPVDIDQFTVTGDMTIVVGDVPVPDPCILGSVYTNSAYGIHVSGSFGYLADGHAGVRVIDISNSANPVIVGSVDTDYARDVRVSGNNAYVADGLDGVKVVDISNSTNPVIVGYVDTDNALGIFVFGDYAYVADGAGGLKIIDVSNPYSPTIVGTVDTDSALGIFVFGDYAYVADGAGGLKIIDVSNPYSPTNVGFVDTHEAHGVFVSENYAYIADYFTMIAVDVSNPGSPAVADSVSIGMEASANRIHLSGDYAYVTYDRTVKVIDIADATNMVIIDSVDTSDIAQGIFVSGNYVYVSNFSSGLMILQKQCGTTAAVAANYVGTPLTGYAALDVNFTDYSTGYPTSWSWDFGDGGTSALQSPSHTFTVPGTYSVSLAVSNSTSSDTKTIADIIVVLESASGVAEIPNVFALANSFPNPLNPQTTISFDLPKQTSVRLRVFDVAGRLVKLLADGEVYSAGRHTIIWGGRDDTDRQVASGVYFYRMEAGEFSMTKRMALVK